jgi:serine/threonine protein kinase
MGLDAMLDTLTPVAPTPVAYALAKLRRRRVHGQANEKDLNDVGYVVLRYFVAVATSVARIPPSDVLRFSEGGQMLCGLDSFPTVVRQLRLAEDHLPLLMERGVLPTGCTQQRLISTLSAWWSSRADDYHALTPGSDPEHLVTLLELLRELLRLEVWVPHSLRRSPAVRERLERILAYDRYRGPSAPEPSKCTLRLPPGAQEIQLGYAHVVLKPKSDTIALTCLYPYLFLGGPVRPDTKDLARGPKSLFLLVPPSEQQRGRGSVDRLSGHGPEGVEHELVVYAGNEEGPEPLSWNTLCASTAPEPEPSPLTIVAKQHMSLDVREIVETAWSLDTDAWVGRGSFGSVYRAKSKHKDFKGRPFAVKVLDPGVEPRPGFGESIDRFARSSGHAPECLVKYYPQLSRLPPESERPYWVAMEFVGTAEGKAAPKLETWLAGQSKYDGLALCHQLAKAVASLHLASVAHRDLHPANILVTEDEDGPQLVIVDLGLATFALAAPATVHASTLLPGIGRHPFAAPEQRFGGARTRPFALDVHALGWLCVMVLGGFGCEVLADRPHACLDEIERGRHFPEASDEARCTLPAVAQMLRSWVHDKPELRPESALDALDQWKATVQHKPTLFPGRTLSNGSRIVSPFDVDTLDDHSTAWCVGNRPEEALLAILAPRAREFSEEERFLEAWDRVSVQGQSLCARSHYERTRSGDLVVVRTPNRPLRPLFSREGHPSHFLDNMPLTARCRMIVGLLDLGVAMAATGGTLAIDRRYVTVDSLGWPFVLRPSPIRRAQAWVGALLDSLFPAGASSEEQGLSRTETIAAGSSPPGTFVVRKTVGLRASAREPNAWSSEEGFLAFAAGRIGWRERRDVTTTLGLAVRTLRSIARVFDGADVILPDGVSELGEQLRDALVPKVRNPRSMGLPFAVARVRSQMLEALQEAYEKERADFVSQQWLELEEREAQRRAEHEREQERAREVFEAEERMKEANDPDYLPVPFEREEFVSPEPSTPDLEFDSFDDWVLKKGYAWESDFAIGRYSPEEGAEIVSLGPSRIELICGGIDTTAEVAGERTTPHDPFGIDGRMQEVRSLITGSRQGGGYPVDPLPAVARMQALVRLRSLTWLRVCLDAGERGWNLRDLVDHWRRHGSTQWEVWSRGMKGWFETGESPREALARAIHHAWEGLRIRGECKDHEAGIRSLERWHEELSGIGVPLGPTFSRRGVEESSPLGGSAVGRLEDLRIAQRSGNTLEWFHGVVGDEPNEVWFGSPPIIPEYQRRLRS